MKLLSQHIPRAMARTITGMDIGINAIPSFSACNPWICIGRDSITDEAVAISFSALERPHAGDDCRLANAAPTATNTSSDVMLLSRSVPVRAWTIKTRMERTTSTMVNTKVKA